MTNAAAFWDKASAKYAKAKIADEAAYQFTTNKTRNYLKPEDEVLEVGCGTGTTALLLADAVGHLTASDISGKMVEIGKGKAQAQNVTNVTFVRADVNDDVLAEKTYDAVLAHNMLHLLEDPASAIKKLHSLLKPGGLFISKTVTSFDASTPFKWRLLKLLLPVMQLVGYAPSTVHLMSQKELEGIITNAGFEIVESGKFPETALGVYVAARKV